MNGMTSLFPDMEIVEIEKPVRRKKAKLGRYERIRRELEQESDRWKTWVDVTDVAPAKSVYNFIDLFCGAGGLTLGLSQAGFKPLAAVEMVPVACATHRRNFPNCRLFEGDVREFDPVKWLDGQPIHVVSGGPPCQGFSVAGRRDPNDERNRLFREFVRVVKELQPHYVVMENVPGILTMQKGAVKEAIFEAFSDIGYGSISVAVLESATYGVAQIRPRAIFIANRFGRPNPYPRPQLKPGEFRPIEEAISDLPAYTPQPEINHEWTRHSTAFMERIAQVAPGASLYDTFADAFKRQYPGVPSMTVKENHGGTHIHPHLNRVISAREMARLQSFPDSFLFEGSIKKAMWQIGNAVPPRLGEVIGLALRPYLDTANEGATVRPVTAGNLLDALHVNGTNGANHHSLNGG